MKIAIAQMNPLVGDLRNNAQKALEGAQKAQSLGASLIIFPELFLCGYPPKDLLLRSDFLSEVENYLQWLASSLPIATLIGAPYEHEHTHMPYNAALFIEKGVIRVAARKRLLPNYNVFDEKRYFRTPENKACDSIDFAGHRLLLSICEDAWNGPLFGDKKRHAFDPVALGFKEHGPIDLFINIQASPYSIAKPDFRERIFCEIARTHKVPVLTVGQVGGNDQLLFDGHSLIIDKEGTVRARAKPCTSELLIYDSEAASFPQLLPQPEPIALMRDALVMGIRDYVEKCKSKGVLLGLSGGIDSAVCASLAVLALGPSRVKSVYLPSRFSSKRSHRDAELCAKTLGISFDIMPIQESVDRLTESLKVAFAKASASERDIAEQNLQARARGILLMGLSNANGHLLLATSNKSELAVGYATLYGDMCGAFSPLGDVYKTDVWRLAHAINALKPVISQAIIEKVPSAELKASQRDDDTLPDYKILDAILQRFIDQDQSALSIHRETGYDLALINQVISMVNRSEYKRRQAPFALMVSEKVFGDARRHPIAASWL